MGGRHLVGFELLKLSVSLPMEEDVKSLADYLAMFQRRKNLFFLVAGILFAIAAVIAVALPSIYQSTATVLIEQQDIPSDLVQSSATTYADQQIQTITQRVMTSTNLQKIIDKYSLYADERDAKSAEEIYDQMRDAIAVTPVSANVVDPRTGRPTEATIAFTISYESKSPDLAQKVANELASLYLSENLRTRTEQAQEASSFMSDETKRLSQHIAELETKLANFKEKNVNRLPELASLNMQLMQRTDQDLMDTRRELRTLEDRRIYLQSQLAQINPYTNIVSSTGERILGPADRLKALEAEYVSKSAIYGADYPDVVQMKREMDALKKELGVTGDAAELQKQLEGLKGELADARKKYSEDHPDVKRLERSIAALESQLKSSVPRAEAGIAVKPDNPAYIQLQSQLESANKDYAAYQQQERELKAKLADYEKRLTQTPQVERQYRELSRDYDNSVARYKELKSKQLSAQLSEQMEKSRKGQRFSLIQPPLLPVDPEKPNRLAILFLGFVLSIGGGLGGVVVSESMDASVRGGRGVAAVLGAPPLVSIPYMPLDEEMAGRKRRLWMLIGLALAAAVLLLVLVNFFYKPLDVIWFIVERKLGM